MSGRDIVDRRRLGNSLTTCHFLRSNRKPASKLVSVDIAVLVCRSEGIYLKQTIFTVIAHCIGVKYFLFACQCIGSNILKMTPL